MDSSVSVPSVPVLSFDLSDWSQIEMSGTGARLFLNNFCTNDIQKLSPGRSCEAFVCDLKGRILGHVLIHAIADRFHLVGVPGTAETLIPHFSKYLLDAPVQIVDRTLEWGLQCLHGPGLSDFLHSTTGIEAAPAPEHNQQVQTAQGMLLVTGTRLLVPTTCLVFGPRKDIAAWQEQVLEKSVKLGTLQHFELLRIESGFPRYGQDLGQNEIAQSAARTKWAISFTKGCYLGQEPIARLDAMGHTNRELRGLLIPGNEITTGAAVVLAEKDIGKVTSMAWSHARSATLALAMIRTQHSAPGTHVHVQTAHGLLPATVYWPDVNSIAADHAGEC